MNTPSTGVQVLITVIPIVGILMGGAVVFFYLFFSHKQKIMLIEKGHFSKKPFDLNTFSLLSGLLLFSIGVGLMVFFIIKDGASYSLLGGIVPFSMGLSLIIFHVMQLMASKKHDKQ